MGKTVKFYRRHLAITWILQFSNIFSKRIKEIYYINIKVSVKCLSVGAKTFIRNICFFFFGNYVHNLIVSHIFFSEIHHNRAKSISYTNVPTFVDQELINITLVLSQAPVCGCGITTTRIVFYQGRKSTTRRREPMATMTNNDVTATTINKKRWSSFDRP